MVSSTLPGRLLALIVLLLGVLCLLAAAESKENIVVTVSSRPNQRCGRPADAIITWIPTSMSLLLMNAIDIRHNPMRGDSKIERSEGRGRSGRVAGHAESVRRVVPL